MLLGIGMYGLSLTAQVQALSNSLLWDDSTAVLWDDGSKIIFS